MASDITPGQITSLLHSVRAGEANAAESLLALAYAELRSLAGAQLARERRGHTLQPTALVHEAWLKLASHIDQVADRTHFFAIAAQAMRRVLTDYGRHRNRDKRGGNRPKVMLDSAFAATGDTGFDLVDLADTLGRLAKLNGRHARVVELRIFGGLTIPEIADVLAVSASTIDTDWAGARAWLRRELLRTG